MRIEKCKMKGVAGSLRSDSDATHHDLSTATPSAP
jgi:hypothetical protein